MTAGKTGDMTAYGMVEIPRRAEYADCSREAFAKLVSGMESSFGSAAVTKGVQETEEQMNLRLKTLGVKQLEIGHPEMSGRLFREDDDEGFAMLTSVAVNGNKETMAGGLAVFASGKGFSLRICVGRIVHRMTCTGLRKTSTRGLIRSLKRTSR